MNCCLRMNGERLCSGVDESWDVPVGIRNHEVNIQRQVRHLPDGSNDRRTDRNIRHEVPIHYIDMKRVRPALFESMQKSGLAARLGEGEVFLEQPVRQTSTLLAIRHAYELIRDRCDHCPRRNGSPRELELYYDI